MPSNLPTGEPPDFAALYPSQVDGGGISPRLAYYLWHCAAFLADTWRDSLDDPARLAQQLPPIAARLADRDWLARFADCFGDLAARLAAGGVTDLSLARSTGEEMALHFVIDLAESLVTNGEFAEDDAVSRLPSRGARDIDFLLARDILFQDHDVLTLFDPALDGIEDTEGPENDLVNLHPRRWFEPFPDQ